MARDCLLKSSTIESPGALTCWTGESAAKYLNIFKKEHRPSVRRTDDTSLRLLPGKCRHDGHGAPRFSISRSRIWSDWWRFEIIAEIIEIAAKLDLFDVDPPTTGGKKSNASLWIPTSHSLDWWDIRLKCKICDRPGWCLTPIGGEAINFIGKFADFYFYRQGSALLPYLWFARTGFFHTKIWNKAKSGLFIDAWASPCVW
jgi:hypothetical protein